MSLPLEGKTALVTGASGGIGRAIAHRLALDGANVGVHFSASADAGRETLEAITRDGGRGFLAGGDLTTAAGREQAFAAVDAALAGGKLDVLINNAGVADAPPFEQASEADFDRVFAVNVKALFFTAQAASRRLADQGGRIVNISTGLTRFTMAGAEIYASSKGAVDVLTRFLAAHFGPRGITVNAVAPGAIEAGMFIKGPGAAEAVRDHMVSMQALKRRGQADDVASVVAFLARKDAEWVTGQWIEASGGAQL